MLKWKGNIDMIERVAFSSKLDIQLYHHIRFVLNALRKKHRDVEISIEYGPAKNEKGSISANVWAGFDGAHARYFLYTAYMDCDLDDYVAVALAIHDSEEFRRALKKFLDEHLMD